MTFLTMKSVSYMLKNVAKLKIMKFLKLEMFHLQVECSKANLKKNDTS